MELPVRIVRATPPEPVVVVDGSLPAARGLELSHWPGNRTPAALRDDLSTGCALRFARLEPAERERLAASATAIVNNHYDTDGSCALFAVRHPGEALARADALLAAARAGDFFQWPDDRALALDATVSGLADTQRSPLAAQLVGRDDLARHQAATDHLLERLPALLDGDLEPYRDLWEPVLDAARCDRDDLTRCTRDDLVHLDWSVWSAPEGARSSRPGAPDRFDPGRHALFGASAADRALVIGPGPEGATYRLVVSTLSWFDLPGRPAQPRPDLAALATRLNELEGSAPQDEVAWRSQDACGPSPELWFGAAREELFAEHLPALRPSRLEPARVRREIAEALRLALLDELEA